jgi:hypothetical protein
MKHLYYFLFTVVYMSLLGFIIWMTQNPWWLLGILLMPTASFDDDDNDEEPTKNSQLNG